MSIVVTRSSILKNLNLIYKKLKVLRVKDKIIVNHFKFKINSFLFVTSCRYSTTIERKKIVSKYVPLSALEQTKTRMRELLFDKTNLSVSEWVELKSTLLVDFFALTELNFDSVMMQFLLEIDNLELAQSFMSYLNDVGHKPNLLTYVKYMVICSRHYTPELEKTILHLYQDVKPLVDPLPVLDHSTVNCLIQGLSVTSEWRTAFSYLDKLPLGKPLLETTNALVYAALRNDEEDIAWTILTSSSYQASDLPNANVIKEYFNCASRIVQQNPHFADRNISKFLIYLQHKNVILKSTCIENIKSYFERHPHEWLVVESKVNKMGCCHGCLKTLDPGLLTKQEFEQLEHAFLKKVVNKSDIYINSTTNEMRNYMTFIKNRRPFDIVIDGLNAAHSLSGTKFASSLANQLLEIVKCLSVTSSSILILGRKHMHHWHKRKMDIIRDKATIFFVGNYSEDDPLTIYAAMASGPKTFFVSSDLMRDHILRLDDPYLIKLFLKWQQTHQVYIVPTYDSIGFQGPLKHHISIQGNVKKGWHIPYDTDFILEPYEELNNWLCIQPINKKNILFSEIM